VLPGVTVQLWLGRVAAWPAPASIVQQIQSIEVSQNDTGRSGFQIIFSATRSDGVSSDYELLDSFYLLPFNRVVIVVTVGGSSTVLMDGVITNRQLIPGDGPGGTVFAVTGEDITCLMDMTELSVEYPAMSAELQAAFILLRNIYLGLIPIVIPTLFPDEPLPVDRTPLQQGTDLRHLQMLANRAGYLFYVAPGPVPLTNYAYWGPPIRIGPPAPAIDVDMGAQTTATNVKFSYDALAPTFVVGLYQDLKIPFFMLPIVTFASLHLPPLAALPALYASLPNIRTTILDVSGLDIISAWMKAQSITDRSTDNVLLATGDIDTIRYGAVLTARGLVGVRGAGWQHDGVYYVKQVVHKLNRRQYTQSFQLVREGYGSTVPAVMTKGLW